MSQLIVDLLNSGVQANNTDRFRHGSLISLPSDVRLIATGDVHGHRRNFERIPAFADLANNPNNHVLLQEVIHGGPRDAAGDCHYVL